METAGAEQFPHITTGSTIMVYPSNLNRPDTTIQLQL